MNTEIQNISLSRFVLSDTPMQRERRRERTEQEIKDLAATIERVGLIHPIVARPDPIADVRKSKNGPLLQIVAGEGRYLAAKLAGWPEIRVEVRDLSDEQVEEIQLIENLQRKDLHELVEAEGYQSLLLRGHTIDEIAERISKSRRTIYTRLQLLKLDDGSREALRRGDLTASTAMLIARVPVESLQKRACTEIVKGYGGDEPMSYRQALEHIQNYYMLQLADAPFPTADEQLVPNAGACGKCPKRTGNQPELFSDVKGADVCTDPPCFKAKREAWAKQQIAAAKAAGRRVITGDQAKKILPYGDDCSVQGGYVRLTDRCHEDPKQRTYRQILGKDFKPDVVQVAKTGAVVEVVPRNAATKALKDAGIIKPAKRSPAGKQKCGDEDRVLQNLIDQEVEDRLFNAVRAKDGGKLNAEHLRYLVADLLSNGQFDVEVIEEQLGFTPKAYYKKNLKPLAKLAEAALARTLIDIVYLMDLELEGHTGRDLLHVTAKRLKIDEKKIRKEVEAQHKPKDDATPAAASKKKAGRKPR